MDIKNSREGAIYFVTDQIKISVLVCHTSGENKVLGFQVLTGKRLKVLRTL